MDIQNKRISDEEFARLRQEVLAQWPTGKDVDLEKKMSTLAAILPKIEGMCGTLMLENYSDSQNGVIFQKKE